MARDRSSRAGGPRARLLVVAAVATTALLAAVAGEPYLPVLENEARDNRDGGSALGERSLAPSPGDPSVEPRLRLPEPAAGPRAIELLGDELPAVARLNDMPAQRLRELLREDPTVWLDRTGRVFFIDTAPTRTDLPAAGAGDASVVGGNDDPVPSSEAAPSATDAFDLHSNPGAARTIFLDFDGAEVSGTYWNSQSGVPSGVHPGWDPAGDGPGFSSVELNRIRSVWARVSEDFAPFEVDVTTRDPGTAAIERSGSADQVYGTRVLVSGGTRASGPLCASRCGGVAYLRAFANSSQHAALQPAWVFPDSLSNDAKSVAEAASHEAGHNLGLNHDGDAAGAYYAGHNMWAPIMGSGYQRPLVQWSRGTYPGATNPENDLAVLAAGGVPVRADEAGATIATAASALPLGSAYITTPVDEDVYALGLCSGSVVAAASPATVSPNLDLSVSLLDGSGAEVLEADPVSASANRDSTTGLGATLAAKNLATGLFFLRVDGVGAHGSATGYDDYGSLGAYTLQVSGCGMTTQSTASPSLAPSPLTSTEPSPTPSPAPTASSPLTPAPSGTATPTASPSAPDPTPTSSPSPTPQRPSAPTMRRARSGTKGSPITARVLWLPPASADPAVTAYRLRGQRLNSTGRIVERRTWTLEVPQERTTATLLFPARGRWRFTVKAGNDVGFGAWSDQSGTVRAR